MDWKFQKMRTTHIPNTLTHMHAYNVGGGGGDTLVETSHKHVFVYDVMCTRVNIHVGFFDSVYAI